jgi:acetolactate synthase II small subunit
MNHAIHIRMRSAEGAAIRAMGLAERRGFQVVSLTLEPSGADAQQLHMVVASPDRCAQLLGRQLERLYDVMDVAVSAVGAARPQPVRMNMAVSV